MPIDPRPSRIPRTPSRRPALRIGLLLAALAAAPFLPSFGQGITADEASNLRETLPHRPDLWSKISFDPDGFRELTFEHLNDFLYLPPGGSRIDHMAPPMPEDMDQPFEERVPERIRMLNGTKVAIAGFLMPLAGTTDAMTEFVLVRNMMICCYGVAPQMTEWILAEAEAERKLEYHRNVPVVMRGVLSIDEVVEHGYVISLLTMEAEDVKTLGRGEFEAFYQRTGAL